ncbi:MAG: hypothetical protein K9K67_14260 [Bacteriovoracaceae bacterium]|nr:hypothetical protein [Bacteriovoracaceae bacterium]
MSFELTQIDEIMQRLSKSHFARKKGKRLTSEGIFWTPVELVKTSFPEKKNEAKRWYRHYGYYSLDLRQTEDGLYVPYGMMARQMFDYFFNTFVDRVNRGVDHPEQFSFNSINEFLNVIKGNPKGKKLSGDQRLLAMEMLYNFLNCIICFKEDEGSAEGRQSNNLFFRDYIGPLPSDYSSKSIRHSAVTYGELRVTLDKETFMRLSGSKRVPTKTYLVELAGNSCMARDLIIFIASQCFSVKKRGVEFEDYSRESLMQVLGKDKTITFKEFNRELKKAINLLSRNFENLYPGEVFPAVLFSVKRGHPKLRIVKEANDFLLAS